jgi:hypothetical protein
LRTHLDRVGLSVPAFCELHAFDRIQIQRVLNGERWMRISVDLAFAIEDATGRKVRARSFLSVTAKASSKASRAAA